MQSGALEIRANGAAHSLKAGESFATAHGPRPRQNLSGRKRAGIIVAIASAVALVAVVLTQRGSDETPDFGGCVIVLSPGAQPCS